MKFFVIPPNTNLELSKEGTAGLFCLTQHYLKDSKYRNFFLKQKELGSYILLDNGVGDHEPSSMEEVLKVVVDLQPNEVVAPDNLFNHYLTRKNYTFFREQLDSLGLLGYIKILYCPQGTNIAEWLSEYEFALRDPWISTIGMSKLSIPRAIDGVVENSDQHVLRSRWKLFNMLDQRGLLKKPLHFLGAQDPREFVRYKEESIVRSMDSCFTALAGINGVDWSSGDFTRISTPLDYFGLKMDKESTSLTLKNIQFLKHMIAKEK